MDPLIVPADRDLRKTVLIVLLFLALVAAVCVPTLRSEFDEIESMAAEDPEAAISRVKGIVTGITFLNAIVSLVFAAYFLSLALKIHRSAQYPPPGMRVIRDTRLRRGSEAKRMALPHLLAAALVLSTNVAMWYLHLVLSRISTSG